jgi:hypothetical protein
MVHLCTAKPPKEGGSDEQLKGASKRSGNGERVTDLGSLGINGESDEHVGTFEIRYIR